MFDFRRIRLFCLEKRLSKNKMTIFSKNLGGHGSFGPPWLRLCITVLKVFLFSRELSLQAFVGDSGILAIRQQLSRDESASICFEGLAKKVCMTSHCCP